MQIIAGVASMTVQPVVALGWLWGCGSKGVTTPLALRPPVYRKFHKSPSSLVCSLLVAVLPRTTNQIQMHIPSPPRVHTRSPLMKLWSTALRALGFPLFHSCYTYTGHVKGGGGLFPGLSLSSVLCVTRSKISNPLSAEKCW